MSDTEQLRRIRAEQAACARMPEPEPAVPARRDHTEPAPAARAEPLAVRDTQPAAPTATAGTAPTTLNAPARGARHVELTSAAGIHSERVRWLWQGRIPLRGQTVVAGEKGLGKSILTNARIPAALTRGQLDGELHGQPVDVLIATAEDDWRSVVKPRLMAHGADLQRVHRITVKDEHGESLLTMPADLPRLEAAIKRLRDEGRTVGLVVVDPIGAFLADSTDSHRDASVRRALAPLAAMADRGDIAVVTVAHLNKDESKKLIARVSGSGGFVNAARSVLCLARDPDDPEGEQGSQRVLAHVASNWGRYAPTLTAKVESRLVDVDDGSRADVGYFNVTGESTLSLDELQGGRDDNGSDCDEAIGQALIGGPRPSRDVKAQVADELKCARKTVERTAVRMAGRGELIIESGGFPRHTTWALDSGDSTQAAVGPPPDSLRVPTASRAVPIDDSSLSRDSRDTRDARVPTASSVPLLAEGDGLGAAADGDAVKRSRWHRPANGAPALTDDELASLVPEVGDVG